MTTRDLAADLSGLAQFLRTSTVGVHDGRRGSGSGVVWTGDGLIVTNAHVVRSKRPDIVFANGRRIPATLLKRDESLDLASLRLDVPAEGSKAAVVRDSSDVVAGELVVAVGNPLGLTGAVTAGMVQRANRRWVVTDVRLAPGNSGGPLADTRGRVIGINSMIAGSLGYAVASSAVQAFLRGAATARRLGVSVTPVTIASLPALLITEVETGSVADRSGLRQGDAIAGADRKRFAGAANPLASVLEAREFEVVRAGATFTIVPAWEAAAEASRAA